MAPPGNHTLCLCSPWGPGALGRGCACPGLKNGSPPDQRDPVRTTNASRSLRAAKHIGSRCANSCETAGAGEVIRESRSSMAKPRDFRASRNEGLAHLRPGRSVVSFRRQRSTMFWCSSSRVRLVSDNAQVQQIQISGWSILLVAVSAHTKQFFPFIPHVSQSDGPRLRNFVGW